MAAEEYNARCMTWSGLSCRRCMSGADAVSVRYWHITAADLSDTRHTSHIFFNALLIYWRYTICTKTDNKLRVYS